MKFSVTLLAGLVGLAVAQTGTTTTTDSTTTSLTPTQTCLAACKTGDVNCQAACLGNPFPNPAQISETAECSAKCSQGDGSPGATQAYANCLAGCRASYFLSTGTNFVGASTAGSGAAATGSSGSAPAGSSASATGSSGAQSSAAASQSSASASASKGAGVGLEVSAPFAGVAGLMMAVFAL